MYLPQLLAVIAVIVLGCYLYLTRHFDYWKKQNIPHETPVALFGNLFRIVFGKEATGSFLSRLYRKFDGPYFGVFGMDEPFLVIKDIDLIKQILVKDYSSFTEKCYLSAKHIDPIFSNSLFASKMPEWKHLRSKLSTAFTPAKLKAMFPLIATSGENMCKYVDSQLNKEIDTRKLTAKYTTDTTATCAFGLEANSFANENSIFRIQTSKSFKEKFTRSIQPLAYVLGHRLVKLLKLKLVETESAKFFSMVFTKSIQHRETTNFHRNDFMDTLISLKEEKSDHINFDSEKLLAQAVSFLIASNETTSSALSFALAELAVHPHMQSRLQKEIKHTIATHGDLNYEAVQDMKYLEMVVWETLRKYPITSFLHRRCTKKYVIEKTGLVLEPGLGVLIPLSGLHMDSKYFPIPEKFDPERFSEDNKFNLLKSAYLPFGDGPRNCLGETFALLNFKLCVIKLLEKFTVETSMNTRYPIQLGRSLIAQPVDGVPLIFKKLE